LEKLTEAAGEGTEALANLWRQRWMAPHREALALDLDRLKPIAASKVAATIEAHHADGRVETIVAGPQYHPDPNTNDVDPQVAKANEIIAAVLAVQNVEGAKRVFDEHRADYDAMPHFLKMKIDIAVNNHLTALDAKAEAGA
jgi:hypothetical protein